MGITKMTGGAFIRQYHPGMFFTWIHCQYFGRTEFHANSATFAPSGVYGDFTARTFFDKGRRSCRRLWLRRNIWHENPFEKNLVDLALYSTI
jgi:hypothetical protein